MTADAKQQDVDLADAEIRTVRARIREIFKAHDGVPTMQWPRADLVELQLEQDKLARYVEARR